MDKPTIVLFGFACFLFGICTMVVIKLIEEGKQEKVPYCYVLNEQGNWDRLRGNQETAKQIRRGCMVLKLDPSSLPEPRVYEVK